MLQRNGFTLLEILVVILIMAVGTVMITLNFTAPNEEALASNAQNNLLAMYSAQQNYRNNNNGSFSTASTLSAINTALSLNTQDDGTYTYSCSSGTTCVASRATGTVTITVTLNTAINLNGEVNPTCSVSGVGNISWCP